MEEEQTEGSNILNFTESQKVMEIELKIIEYMIYKLLKKTVRSLPSIFPIKLVQQS